MEEDLCTTQEEEAILMEENSIFHIANIIIQDLLDILEVVLVKDFMVDLVQVEAITKNLLPITDLRQEHLAIINQVEDFNGKVQEILNMENTRKAKKLLRLSDHQSFKAQGLLLALEALQALLDSPPHQKGLQVPLDLLKFILHKMVLVLLVSNLDFQEDITIQVTLDSPIPTQNHQIHHLNLQSNHQKVHGQIYHQIHLKIDHLQGLDSNLVLSHLLAGDQIGRVHKMYPHLKDLQIMKKINHHNLVVVSLVIQVHGVILDIQVFLEEIKIDQKHLKNQINPKILENHLVKIITQDLDLEDLDLAMEPPVDTIIIQVSIIMVIILSHFLVVLTREEILILTQILMILLIPILVPYLDQTVLFLILLIVLK